MSNTYQPNNSLSPLINEFHEACFYGNLQKLDTLLKFKEILELMSNSKDHAEAMKIAIQSEQLDTVKYLFTKKNLFYINDISPQVIQEAMKCKNFLITLYILEKINRHMMKKAFHLASCEGNLKAIKRMLTSDMYKPDVEIYAKDGSAILKSAFYGQLETLRYFLNYSKSNYDKIDNCLINACISGNLDTIKFLLTSPELEYKATIYTDNNKSLRLASEFGQLEVVKYLLTSKELKTHANLQSIDDECFQNMLHNNHLHVIEYLLIEKNFTVPQKTKQLIEYNCKKNKYIKKPIYFSVLTMIENIDLYNKLNNSEYSTKQTAKKMKV